MDVELLLCGRWILGGWTLNFGRVDVEFGCMDVEFSCVDVGIWLC